MSAYILMVSSADDLRRFAEEVAPATRELVAEARGKPAAEAPAGPVVLESRRRWPSSRPRPRAPPQRGERVGREHAAHRPRPRPVAQLQRRASRPPAGT